MKDLFPCPLAQSSYGIFLSLKTPFSLSSFDGTSDISADPNA